MILAWVIGWAFTYGMAYGSMDDDRDAWVVLCYVGVIGLVAWPFMLGGFIGSILKDANQRRKTAVGVPRNEAQ